MNESQQLRQSNAIHFHAAVDLCTRQKGGPWPGGSYTFGLGCFQKQGRIVRFLFKRKKKEIKKKTNEST